MNFRQFQYFIGVVDAGSFSRAALSLHVAQPALSLQIANLEEELGTPLLVRSQRGVQTTRAGNIFYQSARAVLNEINQLRQTIEAGEGLAGDVSLGLTTSFSGFFAGPIAAATLGRHPNIRIRIFDSPTHLHEQSLLRGNIDIALLPEDAEVVGVQREPLYRQLLFFVERRTAEVPAAGEIRLQDLVGRRLVLPTDPNPTRTVVERAFLTLGAKPMVAAEANSMATLLSLVEAGVGGAIVAWGGQDSQKFRWSKIVDPEIHHDVSLCSARHLPHSECSAAVQSIVSEIVMETIQSPAWRGGIVLPQRP
ncbi:LysR family transcriptional regulator [Bosea caraganae]|uniref:LysR family transcriptional regulator n=1 Tax=Bosea caraganae TaxID=2763117 RepID=A0A370KYD4_9HYPH|nr:LysR substrate-binding domain-containing protein [Bosea caraganae]RDJ20003.1 LysR family transcriptional regulator [Bosea caraganae]RDJ23943.1 LysR family transcriptional regulator [Bosea caraganae]